MNKELILALEALEKENGISKEIMLDTIEKSLKDEFKNQFNTNDNCEVSLDRITGDFHIYANRTVVDTLTPIDEIEENRNKNKREPEKLVYGKEIILSEARKIKPNCEIGDVLKVEIKSEEFSRRAAKAAKGTIVQKIREEEKNAIYNEYHSKEHEIITGIVQRIDENGNIKVKYLYNDCLYINVGEGRFWPLELGDPSAGIYGIEIDTSDNSYKTEMNISEPINAHGRLELPICFSADKSCNFKFRIGFEVVKKNNKVEEIWTDYAKMDFEISSSAPDFNDVEDYSSIELLESAIEWPGEVIVTYPYIDKEVQKYVEPAFR